MEAGRSGEGKISLIDEERTGNHGGKSINVSLGKEERSVEFS